MRVYHLLTLAAATLLLLNACASTPPLAEPAPPVSTPELIDCNDMTPVPDRGSILPTFTPAYPCELENADIYVEFCMVHASTDLSYPCTQTESVAERVIGEGDDLLLIQRDYHYAAGCWHGTSSDTRSLRACNVTNGASSVLAEDVLGPLVPSPDGAWFAFVVPEPGSYRLKPHLFRVRADGTGLMQLDNQVFPQEQVVGAQILQWSEDGEWLEISLWDGHEGGYHRYNLPTDGSGDWQILP